MLIFQISLHFWILFCSFHFTWFLAFCTGALIPLLTSLQDRSLPCAPLRCSQDAVQFVNYLFWFKDLIVLKLFFLLSCKRLESARDRCGPHLALLRSGLHFHPQAYTSLLIKFQILLIFRTLWSFWAAAQNLLQDDHFPWAQKKVLFW